LFSSTAPRGLCLPPCDRRGAHRSGDLPIVLSSLSFVR